MVTNLPGVGLNRGVGLYRATSRDTDALTTSQLRTFHHHQPWSGAAGHGREWNRKLVAEGLYYRITLAGHEVGGLIVTRPGWDHFHIVRIWVEPEQQGRGVGSRALALLEASHRQGGLWTAEVPARARRRHRFFQRNGYEVVGESPTTVQLAKWRPGLLRLRSLP
ncbi:MAG TPA: GNAT family N-acetyltransferase [Natronosporangium sp.]